LPFSTHHAGESGAPAGASMLVVGSSVSQCCETPIGCGRVISASTQLWASLCRIAYLPSP
jgi:hypothetical protein